MLRVKKSGEAAVYKSVGWAFSDKKKRTGVEKVTVSKKGMKGKGGRRRQSEGRRTGGKVEQ